MSATSVGAIALDIGLNKKSLGKQIQQTANEASGKLNSSFNKIAAANGGVEKSFQKVTGMAKKAGVAIAAAFSIKALADFGKSCIDLGSDLTEVQNVVDTVFPHMSEKLNQWAKDAQSTYGLSETMAKQYSGTFGAMAEAFGFTEKQAYDMSTALAGLSGDVASFYNISQDEAYIKLKSVFSGETETLKDLGIVMTQNALDAYALANGYGKTTNAMSEQEKVSLRLAFVTEQLSNAQGDFAKTSDQWANQVRILSLNFSSLKASIGQGLINIMAPALKMINTVIGRLSVLAGKFKAITEVLTGKKTDSGQIAATAAGAKEAEENLDGASGAADNLAKSTKKAAKASRDLMSFDKINKLSEKSDTSSASSSPSGSSGTSSALDSTSTSWDSSLSKMDQSAEKFAKKLQASLRPAQNALKRLYSQGFKKLEKFSIGTLKDFYKNFLKPMGSYVLGEGFPKLVDYTNQFFKKVKWNKLQKSLADFYSVLYKLGRLGFTAIETFYKNVLLKLADWALSEAIPTLLDIFTDFSERINWKALNKAVKTFITAIGSVAKGIGQGLLDFMSGLYVVLRKVAASAINAAAKAITIFAEALNKIPKAGWDVIVGGLAGLFTAILAYQKITTAVTAIKSASLAIKGLFTVFTGSPVKLAITAIGMLSGALLALKGNSKVSVKAEGLEALESSMTQAKDAVRATDRAISDFNKNQNSIELEYGAVEDMADEYYKLSQKTKLSADEKKRLKTYAKQLVDKIPELVGAIDTETGAYSGTEEQLKKTIKKTKEYYMLQAAEKDMANVSQKLYKSKKKIQEAQDNLNDVTAKYNKVRATLKKDDEQQNTALQMSAKEYDKLVEKMNQYKKSMDSAKKTLSSSRGEYTKQSREYDKITQAIGDMQESYDDLNKDLDKTGKKSKSANEELKKTPSSKKITYEADTTQCYAATEEAKKAETKEITLKAKKDKGFNQTVKDSQKSVTAKVKLEPAKPMSDIAKEWQKQFEKNFKPSWTLTINGIKGTVKQERNNAYWSKKAKGGVYDGKAWKKVQRYASGGLPAAGQMFVANENGPELVGKIGTNTGVVNNDQIVASVASGVYGDVSRALASVTSGMQMVAQRVVKGSTPPLASVDTSNNVSMSKLVELAQQAAGTSQENQGSKELIELLKEILALLRSMDLDIYMDGEKVTKKIVRVINTHTKANGRCEIVM